MSDQIFLPERQHRCRLRAARAVAGITQTELARLIGRDKSWVSRLEAGLIDASPTEQARIAGALGFPTSVVFPEESDED